jgi:predicted RNA-binding Zn-ribbon protein involved in translation (DUF1610 family)
MTGVVLCLVVSVAVFFGSAAVLNTPSLIWMRDYLDNWAGTTAFLPLAVTLPIVVWMIWPTFSLRSRVRRADYSLCIHCGYDLTSIKDNAPCPECGRPVDLDAYRKRWRVFCGPADGKT